jgi:glycosyltransferase involved in cell wall biosynthesis
VTSERSVLVFYPHNYVQATSGTHARFLQLARYFRARGLAADLISLDGFTNHWDRESLDAANQFFRNVTTVAWRDSWSRQVRQRLRGSRRLEDLATPELHAAWREAFLTSKYSHTLVSYAYWGAMVNDTPTTVTTIVDLVDCLTLHHMHRRAEGFEGYGRMLEDECRAISRFDHALSISQSERGILEVLCRDVVFHDIPMAVANDPTETLDTEYDLLFVGSDNPFNVTGLRWFLEQVLPFLHGSPRVAVAGRVCDVVALPPQVRALHHVAVLSPVYAATSLVICPLLGGTGQKVKVIEALSHGVPVVTTRWGVDGMSPGFAECCVVADSASAFASAIDECLAQPERITRMGEAARRYANNNYSEAVVWDRLDSVFDIDSRRHN